MSKTKLAIIFLVALLIATVYPGLVYKWYTTKSWFDTVLHFLGGFFTAMLIFSFYQSEFKKTSLFFQLLALAGMTMGIGVVWEFSEYIGSQLFVDPFYRVFKTRVYFMGNLDDTMDDLLMDFLGVLAFWISSRARKPFFFKTKVASHSIRGGKTQ